MKSLALTPELEEVARRCVWFKEPAETLRYPEQFIAYVMTYGQRDDARVLERYLSRDELAQALRLAPPGIFDARSWVFWHLRTGELSPPPLPQRVISDDHPYLHKSFI